MLRESQDTSRADGAGRLDALRARADSTCDEILAAWSRAQALWDQRGGHT